MNKGISPKFGSWKEVKSIVRRGMKNKGLVNKFGGYATKTLLENIDSEGISYQCFNKFLKSPTMKIMEESLHDIYDFLGVDEEERIIPEEYRNLLPVFHCVELQSLNPENFLEKALWRVKRSKNVLPGFTDVEIMYRVR